MNFRRIWALGLEEGNLVWYRGKLKQVLAFPNIGFGLGKTGFVPVLSLDRPVEDYEILFVPADDLDLFVQ